MKTKICTKCNKEKPLTEFHKQKFGKLGVKASCKECCNKYRQQYYIEYKDREISYNKKYSKEVFQVKHPDYLKEYSKQYRIDNPKYHKEHIETNRSRYNNYWSRRRARKINATVAWANQEIIKAIYKECSELNALYGKPARFHVDHIIPLSKGGLHVENNLVIVSAEENLSKNNRVPTNPIEPNYII